MIGFSVRLALALGLHLRNEDPEAEASRKKMLERTWWTLHSIECLISIINGRPTTIPFADTTVSLPYMNIEEDYQDNQGSSSRKRSVRKSSEPNSASKTPEIGQDNYFLNHVKLTVIAQEVLIDLYSPRTASESWHFVQGKMSDALQKLEAWYNEALPPGFPATHEKLRPGFNRERFLLTADYWGTKILITRPCVCRLERRIKNESSTSAAFNATSAEACVEAALEMAKMFPEEPNLEFVYGQGPWWAINHLSKSHLIIA